MICRPHVKINLGLSVLRKRSDGYHDIETAFVPYHDIHDTLEVIPADEYSLTSASIQERYNVESGTLCQAICADGKLLITVARSEGVDWDVQNDLCAKAYRLLNEDFSLPPAKIYLEKTSPVGAGLGGGSSDGAFCLKMLSQLFELGLSEGALSDYAARLGSDCPFFIYNTPMIGKGRGEILEPFSLEGIDYDGSRPDAPYELKVIVPEGISVSTAEAYRGVVPSENRAYESLKEAIKLPIEDWKDLIVNDFEKSVFSIYPQLAAIKQSLYDSGAVYTSLSGSGAALFAIYKR